MTSTDSAAGASALPASLPASPFARLGLPAAPVVLAPLAGVSDHPFRRLCARAGADLTYVEMLSATALLNDSRRTFDMMRRHPSETILGVQLTGKTPEEVGQAVEILGRLPYETIDLNMGCPVAKVVKSGCGSGILRDPARVYATVRAAVQATDKPVSVKFRLGWDKSSYTYLEVTDAAQSAGAAWLTIHGRLRADDYSVPVDLGRMAEVKSRARIPVLGNGNVFCRADHDFMTARTGVDGVMVSRGALGNPWVFRETKSGDATVTRDEWLAAVLDHLAWQAEEYGPESTHGAICMRKHLLWYAKGWPGAKRVRETLTQVPTLAAAREVILYFAEELGRQGIERRLDVLPEGQAGRFAFDPKYDMDRRLDRGVGDDGLEALSLP